MSRRLSRMWRTGVLSLLLLLLPADNCLGADRIIRAGNMTVAPGETNRLYIALESLGDENAVSFSVSFDTNYLTLIRAVRGSSVSNLSFAPTFLTNIIHAASRGQIGAVLSLAATDPSTTFPAGSNSIMEILFRGTTNGSGSVMTTVSFTNSPVGKEMVDGNGEEINPADVGYASGTVLIQGACSYALNTNTASFTAAGGAGSVNVTTSAGCTWTVVNTNSWITITSATDGTVSYTLDANPNFTARTGVMTIAGQTFTVNQAGFVCAYSLSATTRDHGYGAATNSVDLTTSDICAWTVVSSNEWITVLSAPNGNGSTSVDYAVAANPNLVGRTGSVMMADQFLTLIQGPFECTYQLSPTSGTHGPGASSVSFSVIADPVCEWAATTTNNWITLVSGANGPGSNTVGYLIGANPDGVPRHGAIFVGDQVFAITQLAAPCEAELTPASLSHGFGIETGVVSVAIPGGCPWQVVNTNSWITIDSAANGTVGYTVASNTAFVGRSGVLTIAGRNFVVTQAAVPCRASVSPTSASHSSGMETGLVSVIIGSGCGWTVNNTNTWITILSGSSGTGDGPVTYAVASNLNVTPRSGTVWIDDTPFVVNQSAYVCTYELSLTNVTHDFGVNTNTVNVTAGPNCEWSAVTTNDWISLVEGASGTGNGNFTYSILPNPGATTRTGVVMVADQVLTLVQSASAGGFVFESMTMNPSGDLTLKLNGGPPGIWEIQTSSNLVTWTKLTNITNTTGKVEFIAPSTGNDKHFYRAVLP